MVSLPPPPSSRLLPAEPVIVSSSFDPTTSSMFLTSVAVCQFGRLALPTLFSGLRIALPVALIVTIITELIGESRGLGYFVTFQTASFEYARALAAFVVIAVIGFCLDRLLLALRNRLIFWQKDAPFIA